MDSECGCSCANVGILVHVRSPFCGVKRAGGMSTNKIRRDELAGEVTEEAKLKPE
jgi:hypothetical protein